MIQLRDFGKDDFDQLINWIHTEELMMNWSGNLFRFPLTHDSLNWYISNTNDSPDPEAYVYKAIDAETGEGVGHISLGGISTKNRSARISRVLIAEGCHRGKGYCSGMVKAILEVGFDQLKLHRITLGVYDTNIAAIKCYERAGFRQEGLHRDILFHHGKYWSMVEMAILEDEWNALKAGEGK